MTKKLTPAILSTSEPRTYLLEVAVSGGTVSMRFTDRNMANQEYNRIKGQGIYLGQWLEHIELKESANE
jgi:hypothetical protein